MGEKMGTKKEKKKKKRPMTNKQRRAARVQAEEELALQRLDKMQAWREMSEAKKREILLRRLDKVNKRWTRLPKTEQDQISLSATSALLQKIRMEDPLPERKGGPEGNLWDYAVERELEQLSIDKGLARCTKEDPTFKVLETPGWQKRKGKPKSQLRPTEQDALGLHFLGQGHLTTYPPLLESLYKVPVLRHLPFLRPQLDASFGVFGNPAAIEDNLADWARKNAEETLSEANFYQSAICAAPQIEATALFVVARDVPLETVQKRVMQPFVDSVVLGASISRPAPEFFTELVRVERSGEVLLTDASDWQDHLTPAADVAFIGLGHTPPPARETLTAAELQAAQAERRAAVPKWQRQLGLYDDSQMVAEEEAERAAAEAEERARLPPPTRIAVRPARPRDRAAAAAAVDAAAAAAADAAAAAAAEEQAALKQEAETAAANAAGKAAAGHEREEIGDIIVDEAELMEALDLAVMFQPGVLEGLDIVSADGNTLLAGTHLILSTNSLGGLSVEAMAPGAHDSRSTYLLGEFASPQLTYHVFDHMFGSRALDKLARFDIGAALLYFANGFFTEQGSQQGRAMPTFRTWLGLAQFGAERRGEEFSEEEANYESALRHVIKSKGQAPPMGSVGPEAPKPPGAGWGLASASYSLLSRRTAGTRLPAVARRGGRPVRPPPVRFPPPPAPRVTLVRSAPVAPREPVAAALTDGLRWARAQMQRGCSAARRVLVEPGR